MNLRTALYVLPLLLVVLIGLILFKSLYLDPKLVPSVLIDQPAPQFQLKPLDASLPGLKSEDLKGQVTLINLFASWCIPCRVEHPFMLELARRKDLRLVGINYKDKPEDARQWLTRLGNPYDAIGVDEDGRVAIDFGLYGVPESYLIDRQGRIRFKQVGPFSEDDIAKKLLPLVAILSR